MRRALHDLRRGGGAAVGVGERIEEGRDEILTIVEQQDRLAVGADDRRPVRVELEPRQHLVEHRVAEAIDGVGELRGDGRVEMDVDVAEQVDGRRDLARELLEHEVLVLRLGAELGGLEQALAVPLVVLDAVGEIGPREHPVAGERAVTVGELGADQILGLLEEAVVLRMEDLVHGREADVLVGAPVTGDVMRVEQLVVVEAGIRRRTAGDRVGVGQQAAGRIGTVRDIVEEGMSRAEHGPVRVRGIGVREVERVGSGTGLDERDDAARAVLHGHLHSAVGAQDDIAVVVGLEQRHVADELVGEQQAELQRVGLDVGPGRHRMSVGAGEQASGRMDVTVDADHVLAQEHLVRRV